MNFRAVSPAQIYEDVVWQKHLLLCQDLLVFHNVCALMPNERVNLFLLMFSVNCLHALIHLHFSHIHRMLLEWYKQCVKGQICWETRLCHTPLMLLLPMMVFLWLSCLYSDFPMLKFHLEQFWGWTICILLGNSCFKINILVCAKNRWHKS